MLLLNKYLSINVQYTLSNFCIFVRTKIQIMKNKLLYLIFCGIFSFNSFSQNNVTFQVDMNNVDPTTFTTPEVNGTFNGWCGNCNPMSDADGDNIWDITIDLANGSYEFKFSADNWGIQENLLSGSWCTMTNWGFTNRTLNVSGDTTLSVVCWESCSSCSSGPSAYDVTFELDMRGVTQPFTTPEVNGIFNGWCGNCWQMADADGDSIWHLQMPFAPGDSLEWKYSADNWNIQEDLDSSLSCVTINYDPGAPNGWGYVNRVAVVNSDTTFSSAWNLCPTSAVTGCTDSLASNYDSLATSDDGSCLYSVTFNVDMNCEDSTSYGFVHLESPSFAWCGGCVPMTDPDGDGIHSVSVDLALGNFEYKYAVDNFAGQEDLIDDMIAGASCAPITDYNSYANRQINVTAGFSTSDTYGSCDACVLGCTDSTALNFDPLATSDDGSCTYCNYGCMDSLACNYDPMATCDDGSCLTTYGCTDTLACNFDPIATCDDGSCLTTYGCMNPAALNYDSLATCPDSCIFPQVTYGCTDSTALNYNPLATIDDSSCIYCTYGCMDSLACNYDPMATCDDGSCLTNYGCTDSLACNYDPMATCDDGSCLTTYGCTDSLACNFDPLATCDDGSCLTSYGCTDTLACNFDPLATCDDGSCLTAYGCTDSLATNYDPLATCEDSSCVYGYYVTFQLDLRGVTSITYTTPEVNGMFNGWCGSCNPLEDLDGDSIWETTLLIDPGTYEFKYSADNFNVEENLFAGDSCTVSSFGFTNRTITVDRDTVLAPVCWELCGDCDSGPSSYNVTFRLDMSEYVGPPFQTPEVNGTFNGWCGSCWAMEDPDGDDIWEFTALIGAGDSIQFKYSTDNWNLQEDLDSSLSCVSVAFDPGAPNGWGYVNRLEVINSETVLDVVCWNDCVECQGQSFVGENLTDKILLYPNPSKGTINIKSTENINQIKIYSVLGKLIYSEKGFANLNEYSIDLDQNGLYYVTVYTENSVLTEKITIQK